VAAIAGVGEDAPETDADLPLQVGMTVASVCPS
jgi:hypothetical protein